MHLRSVKRRGSLVVAFVALIAVLAMLTPASAVQSFVVAGRSNLYYTPLVVVQKGQPVIFVNLDLALHDVRHSGGLFTSALIGFGKKTPVIGVKTLARGAYRFYCTQHEFMKGTLRVV